MDWTFTELSTHTFVCNLLHFAQQFYIVTCKIIVLSPTQSQSQTTQQARHSLTSTPLNLYTIYAMPQQSRYLNTQHALTHSAQMLY